MSEPFIDAGIFIDYVWDLRTERDELRAELTALKAGQDEVVVLPPQCTDRKEHVKYRCGWNSYLSAVVRLNPLRRGTPMAQLDRHMLSQAASDWLTENDPNGLDWCDARNVDALIDALLAQSQEV